MRVIKPVLALATLLATPFVTQTIRENNDATRALPTPVQAEQPFIENITPVPFIMSAAQEEDVASFFHVARDPEKGFIYLRSDESTEGIAKHLIEHHGVAPEQVRGIIENIDELTKEFNEKATTLEQVEITFKSLMEKMRREVNPENLPHEEGQVQPAFQLMPVLVPSLRDYVSPDEQIEISQSDGMIHEISVLPYAIDIMTGHGFPNSMHLEAGMDVIADSESLVIYADKRDRSMKRAPFLKMSEPEGRSGPGGINGVIFTGPTVIIDEKIFFINFEQYGPIKSEKFDPEHQTPERNFNELFLLKEGEMFVKL